MTPEDRIQSLENRLAKLEKRRADHKLLWISIAIFAPLGLWAVTTIPNTFKDGDTLTASQVNDNFQALADATVPAGTIIAFGGSSAPPGWLLCNGVAVSRGTYSGLYNVIGTSFGAGDGAATFHLPDLRGRFLRGRDATAGRDPDAASRTASNGGGNSGDAVGSIQGDAFQGHWHDLWIYPNDGVGGSSGNDLRAQNSAASNIVRNPITDGVNGNPRTSSETRPVNAYVNFIIKY